MNAPQAWDSLSRNQKNLTGLAALLVVLGTGFGAMKAIDPYLPGSLRAEIAAERRERLAADQLSVQERAELRESLKAVLKGQEQLLNALGMAVDVLAAPGSQEAAEARRKLRRMRTRRFDPDQP